ncbi:hypothetical protein [Nocardiopsis sp. RV163]|uniref:hypothetical protein n=1 Tax=Nocardiopsis sp. RV163 TaxID=1661388 RepID=UPI00064BEF49|nr:hypothetical protein [Nocardiopsis sp. RV163]
MNSAWRNQPPDPTDLADLVEALAETLRVPRPLEPTPETERQFHALLRDRVAHARDALLSLGGEGRLPDLGRLAGWLYTHAAEPPYRAVRGEDAP